MLMSTVFAIPTVSKVIAGTLVGSMVATGAYFTVTAKRITRTVQDVFAACGLCNMGANHESKSWNVKKVTKTDHGFRLVMKFPYGKTLADVTRKADAINTALGVDVAFTRDGNMLIMDIPLYPLPSYLSYPTKVLELTRGNWRVPVGMGSGGWVFHDFDERPHLLVAGLTRGGKSVFLASTIATLHLSHQDDKIDFIGVDMKPFALEFRKFYGVWNTLASTPEDFLAVLMETDEDMQKRAETLANAGCSNVKDYERITGIRLRRRFIIVDEYGRSFGSDVEKEIKQWMMQVTAQGAGLGVHVILCTQRPDADVIDGKIRANVGSVVCMQVATDVQSRVVLGHNGAETLPDIPGRAIYQGNAETIVQVPYISDAKLKRLLPDNIPMSPKSNATSQLIGQTRSAKVVRLDDR